MRWKRKRKQKAAETESRPAGPVYKTVDGKPIPAMVVDERLIGTSIIPT